MKVFDENANRQPGVWKSLTLRLSLPLSVAVVYLSFDGILQGEIFLDDYYQLHVYREGVSALTPFFRDLWIGACIFRKGIRTNPVVHDNILYGMIEADARQARELAGKRQDVHLVLRGTGGLFREVVTGALTGRQGER